jgi:hypothetical protein
MYVVLHHAGITLWHLNSHERLHANKYGFFVSETSLPGMLHNDVFLFRHDAVVVSMAPHFYVKAFK